MSLLYNPHLQSADDLVASFIDRQGLLRSITEELRGESPQHHLLVGQRGMGKTTLLQRIAAEIGRDTTLHARWIALRFPEEQYNVGRLSELWLNCLDALADALEREGKVEEVTELEEFVASLPLDEDRRSTLALDRLRAVAAGPRGLVLLIDNLQQLLGRLKDDHWALRKVFGEEPQLVVIAASPAPIEQDYSEALYDFFAAHSLRRLDDAQLRAMLLGLAEREGKPEVTKAVEAHPARLRALRLLSGGNPRTAAQLYTVLARSPEADLRTQLEGLVDLVTPLYKARFEELAEQAQLTLDALARHWDPATAAILAEQTRLEVNSISTQLHRLQQEGWIDKVDIPGEARQGFQVAERFFNLWYLMRASRRLRGRLMTLAGCLEILYEPDLLSDLSSPIAEGTADPDLAAALSMRVAEPPLRDALKPLDPLPQLLPLLSGLIRHGHIAEAAARVAPLAERALPLKAAMEAIVGGDAELVRRYAPEVAEPARELLDLLWPTALRPPPPARGKKTRRRS